MARSPCRKIPKESMRAPFSQPRLSVPCVGLEDTDVLLVVVEEPAGISAAPPPPVSATSCNCGSMFTPLTASMWPRGRVEERRREGGGEKPQSPERTPTVCMALKSSAADVGQLIDTSSRSAFAWRWRHPLTSEHTVILLQTPIHTVVEVRGKTETSLKRSDRRRSNALEAEMKRRETI